MVDVKVFMFVWLLLQDTQLPKGSHVFATGLADGRVLFDTLKDKIHPIGDWRQDITYPDIYNYLNCLESSPCSGWMTTNETLRNFTSEVWIYGPKKSLDLKWQEEIWNLTKDQTISVKFKMYKRVDYLPLQNRKLFWAKILYPSKIKILILL